MHFTGWLSYDEHRMLLRSSSAHVYLTRPFVLSWSTLEAMSTGCMLVASNTPPVREVVEHGLNGLLVDFFNTEELVATLCSVLDDQDSTRTMREKARQTIQLSYDQRDLFPRRVKYLTSFAG